MNNEPKFDLMNLSPEEGKQIGVEIDAILAKYSATFVVLPIINPNGTLGAKVEIYKKVQLVPKDGIPSPYPLDGKDDQKPEAEKTV